jgi:uncharacterized phage-like protein YoqJ
LILRGTTITEAEKRMRRACFTGHRTYKLTRPEREIERDLETAIRQAVAEGYKTFITGMAYGVDLWVGEIVVRLRGENDGIRLIAAVPFPGFEARWPAAQQREYHDLLRQADLVRYISKAYYGGAYQRQNEWMVNHASRLTGDCSL